MVVSKLMIIQRIGIDLMKAPAREKSTGESQMRGLSKRNNRLTLRKEIRMDNVLEAPLAKPKML
jgi:hypothetical protein